MIDPTVSSTFDVANVTTDADVRKALQALYDIFAGQGIGQATFVTHTDRPTELIVKHAQSVTPDPAAVDAALRRAGDFRLL